MYPNHDSDYIYITAADKDPGPDPWQNKRTWISALRKNSCMQKKREKQDKQGKKGNIKHKKMI